MDLLRAQKTTTDIARAEIKSDKSLLAVPGTGQSGTAGFPSAGGKPGPLAPGPPSEADHVPGEPGLQAVPHPADATGRNQSSKAGPSFPPHWRERLSLRPGTASHSRVRDNGGDVTDVTQGWREGAGGAQGGPGAISKCATR